MEFCVLMPQIRKKLIEVSIPLEAINKASAREKSIRHGHPSTLHLWWARRPLAACRAVLFSQLVDDPSSWPDRFPTEAAQDKERKRLHKIIEDMVPWKASNDERIFNAARWEIARSVAWGLGEEPPPQQNTKAILDYLQAKAPPVYDPFSGGGSIPLEAQRLGLRTYGSDLNPVAVLIGKALVEIPPKFAGQAPVNSKAQEELKHGGQWNGKGAQGLAEDVRYFGQWMRDEAGKRIGHLFPKAQLEDGSDATVIAWLWARTVRSPDPAANGAMVPLLSSYMLADKERRRIWVQPVFDSSADDGYRFEIVEGQPDSSELAMFKRGNKAGRSGFTCLLTGSAISFDYIRKQAVSDGLGKRLLGILVQDGSQRRYIEAQDTEMVPTNSLPENICADGLVTTPSHDVDRLPMYGMPRWRDAFTSRQLISLTTFAGLVSEVEALATRKHAALIKQNKKDDNHSTNIRSQEYGRAVATYLGLAVGRAADYWSTITTWVPSGEFVRNTFARQAIAMSWDFVESNPFSDATGNWMGSAVGWIPKVIEGLPASGEAQINQIDAQANDYLSQKFVVSTDPPYYDNIGYADLSDFFYVWHKQSLGNVSPELFRRLLAPKGEELVASPHRHGGRDGAETFFLQGMKKALDGIQQSTLDSFPLAIYYAFKQSEIGKDGVTSAGWASFLQAVVNTGFLIDGTWPVRTEMSNRVVGKSANMLASSIVLVCRKRPEDADTITRADFIRLLKRELPDAIDDIRKAGVGPVDMQQSVIGPGMGVFSSHAKVLEDDDSPMTVKTALAIINRIWGEIENEGDTTLDAETQVALAWFASYGFDPKSSGELITLANAKNIPTASLFRSEVFEDLSGRSGLKPRDRLSPEWTPDSDTTLTIWECVQHAARALGAEDGGDAAAARLIAQMGPKAADARALAYRLFQIATDKGWAAEALVYNELAAVWPRLEGLAEDIASISSETPAKPQLDLL
jgi:putative DNA methylase